MFLTESNLTDPLVLTGLLRSAYAISQEDRRTIRSLVEQKIAHLAALDDEIVELGQQIALAHHNMLPSPQITILTSPLRELNRIHENMAILISHLNSLLSPIRRLPLELLSRVFLYTLPPDRFVRPTATRSPLLLCAVSASWRALATANPLLWSSLAVSSCKDGHCKPNLALIQLWISRSGSYVPLDLSLVWSSNSATTSVRGVWSAFMSQVHRWRRFKLLLLSSSTFFNFAPHITQNASGANLDGSTAELPTQLRAFTFRSVDLTDSAGAWLSKTLSRCGDLQELEWCVSLSQDKPLPPMAGMSSLTTLRLDGRCCTECLDAMRLCPNLEECRLRLVYDGISSSSENLTVRDVTLSKLRAFELRTGSVLAIQYILNHLSTPKLDKLRISGDCLAPPFLHDSLLAAAFSATANLANNGSEFLSSSPLEDFIRRSAPPLHALYLHPTSIVPSSNIISFLHILPHLKILHLGQDFVINDAFLTALTLPPSILTYCDQDIDMEQLPSLSSEFSGSEDANKKLCLCPRLDWLIFERTSYSCSDGLLSAMVESRCRIAAPGTERHHIPDPLHHGARDRTCTCCAERQTPLAYPLTPPRSRSPSLDSTFSYSSLDSWAYQSTLSRGVDILPSPPPSPFLHPAIVSGAQPTPFTLHATIPASHNHDRMALAKVRVSRSGL